MKYSTQNNLSYCNRTNIFWGDDLLQMYISWVILKFLLFIKHLIEYIDISLAQF